jgi:hypothetical protein
VKTPRLAVAGLAVLASALLALTGCNGSNSPSAGGSSPAPASSAAASSSPTDTVLAAVKKLNQSTYKYTLTTRGLTGQGSVDPPGKKIALTLTGKQSGLDVRFDTILIASDYWLKLDFGAQNRALNLPAGKWMHIDQTKVKNWSTLGVDPSAADPTRTSGLFEGMTDAKQVDAKHYTVTLDLTRSTGSFISSADLTRLGDKAKAVPANVTLDDQGRLAAVSVDLSAIDPNASLNTTYTDHGAPVSINAPAPADVVEAPAAVYQVLNSTG